MTIKNLYVLFLILISSTLNAQIFDKYGVRAGVGFSNQCWKYSYYSPAYEYWNNYRAGLSVNVNAEKQLREYISVRTEFGYIQKGFVDNQIRTNIYGEEIPKPNKEFILHNFSGSAGFKFSPLKTVGKPYLIAGLRVDYLVKYKDVLIEREGVIYRANANRLEDMRKFTLGGLIGVGIEYKEFLYLEIEFNPTLSQIIIDDDFAIQDRYFGGTLGLNINSLFEKAKK